MPRHWLFIAIAYVAAVSAARADRIAIPVPGIDRVAAADAIVVGRVIAIEPQDIDVPTAPGAKLKQKYRVAVVNVSEVVLGKKETKTVRVGFVPVNEKKPFGRGDPYGFKLNAGQHGMLYLRKHPAANIYVGRGYYDFIAYHDGKTPLVQTSRPPFFGDYQNDLKQARRAAKVYADPLAALKAKDQPDRYFAAAHLIARYRTPKAPSAKSEPVSAEETRLILAALLEQDWHVRTMITPSWSIFNMLGLTEKDGWKAPRQVKDMNDLRAAAQAWHREHGKDYRIQRFVAQ